jgi:Flp pilus assembly CpaF family ATPase
MSSTAFDQLRTRVLGLVAARDVDVGADQRATRQLVEAETERFQRELMRGAAPGLQPFVDPSDVVERLVRELNGIGAQLDALVADPDVEEIYGRDGEVTARLVGGRTKCADTPVQAGAVLAVLQRLLAAAGENVDALDCPGFGGGIRAWSH